MRALRESRAGRGDRLAWELGTPLSEQVGDRGHRRCVGASPTLREDHFWAVCWPRRTSWGHTPRHHQQDNTRTCRGEGWPCLLLLSLRAGCFQHSSGTDLFTETTVPSECTGTGLGAGSAPLMVPKPHSPGRVPLGTHARMGQSPRFLALNPSWSLTSSSVKQGRQFARLIHSSNEITCMKARSDLVRLPPCSNCGTGVRAVHMG